LAAFIDCIKNSLQLILKSEKFKQTFKSNTGSLPLRRRNIYYEI